MNEIFDALNDITNKYVDYCCIFPVHKNPIVRKIVQDKFKKNKNVKLIEPLNVFDFHKLMSLSSLIVTDSGGIQEEAPSFNVPVYIIRDNTERPEGLTNGIAKLVGTSYQGVYDSIESFINKKELM